MGKETVRRDNFWKESVRREHAVQVCSSPTKFSIQSVHYVPAPPDHFTAKVIRPRQRATSTTIPRPHPKRGENFDGFSNPWLSSLSSPIPQRSEADQRQWWAGGARPWNDNWAFPR